MNAIEFYDMCVDLGARAAMKAYEDSEHDDSATKDCGPCDGCMVSRVCPFVEY